MSERDEEKRKRAAAGNDGETGGDEVDEGRRAVVNWLWRLPVLAALGAGGYAAYEGYQVLFGKGSASEEPRFEPVDPVQVAQLDQFPEVWSEATFVLPASGVPAIAIRTPHPVAGGISISDNFHLVGFSRICTHLGCTVSLNRDTEAVAFAFNYRSDTPSLTCPCHLSVFDPERQGQAVSGPAVDPLPRVELQVEGSYLLAVGIETTTA